MICVLLKTYGCVIMYFAPLPTAGHQAYAPILTSFPCTGSGWISQAPRTSQPEEQTYVASPKSGTGYRKFSVGSTGRAPRAQRPAWRYKPKKSFKYHPTKSFKYQRSSRQKYRAKRSFKYHPQKKGWKYNPRNTVKHHKPSSELREL